MANICYVEMTNIRGKRGKRHTPTRDIHVNQVHLTVGGKVLLNEETTFKVNTNSKYGIIGCNGLGKSVLMKRLSQREKPFQGIPEHINIIYVEQEIGGDRRTMLDSVMQSNKELLWLFEQEKLFSDSDTNQGLYDEMTEKSYDLSDIYDRMRGIKSYSAETRARQILNGIGFSSDEVDSKKTSEYSGGWRMRVALACALFGEPGLLILDEPTNHLDIPAVIWLESYLSKWKKSLILVSHDSNFLDQVLEIENVENNYIIHLHDNYAYILQG